MTALVFNSGRFTVMTESWMATEYRPYADSALTIQEASARYHLQAVEVHAKGKLVGARLKMSMDEFIQLIAEGGKIVDLRKLQEPR
jgi:hypothetical protein